MGATRFPNSLGLAMSRLRIVVPAKGNSARAPGKNALLLPYTMEYLRRLGLQKCAYVLTDCPNLSEIAETYGVAILPEVACGNDFAANFTASYRALHWGDADTMVLLEPTKPFRQRWLLASCLSEYARMKGHIVTTGVHTPVTLVEYVGDAGKAHRHTGIKVLDGSVVVTTCGDYSRIKSMSELWNQNTISVVWHHAPSGIDFDYPVDLECHLPTVSRLWSDWFFRT